MDCPAASAFGDGRPATTGLTYTVKQTLTCPDNVWLTTSNDMTSACCTWANTRTLSNQSCGGYRLSGTVTLYQTLNRSTCSYSTSTTSDNCVCKNPTTVNINPTCPPAGQPTLINYKVCATTTQEYWKYNNAAGVYNASYATAPCSYAHNDTPYLTNGSCQTANYIWGTGSATYDQPLDASAGIPKKGDACVGGTAPSACIVKTGSTSNLYQNCTCDRIVTSCTAP